MLHLRTYFDPIDHHVDVVLLGFLQCGQIIELIGLAIDAKAHETLRLHLGKQLQKLAFLFARHWRQDHQPGVKGQCQHRVHHLAHGLALQRQAVLRAVGRAGAGKQQAQVVVNLGDGADGGARVVAGGLLFDGDGGRQPFDDIHIRLVHQLQELARIGGQTLHVAALPLGIERVKRQAGLARPRQAGDHHQLVARDIEINVLQVVRARAPHADGLLLQGTRQIGALGVGGVAVGR